MISAKTDEKTYKLLVADDDPSTIKSVLNYLSQPENNFDIYNAPNGHKAIEVTQKIKPDIILMDWDMPVLNGIEAINLLKKDPETEHIPIIMATGVMTSTVDLSMALDCGAIDYLRKPIDKFELLARIKSAIRYNNNLQEVRAQYKKVSEQNKRIERQIEEIELHKSEIVQLNELKEHLLFLMGHDLKQEIERIRPTLTNIIQYFQKENITEPPDIVEMQNIGIKGISLVNNLIYWTRLQRNELVYHPQNINLNMHIEQVLIELNRFISRKSINLQKSIPEKLFVYVDMNMFTTILKNILFNAIQYSPLNSEINITAVQTDYSVKVSVSDKGPGIVQEKINRLLNSTISTDFFGAELSVGGEFGLFVSRNLIAKNGGKLNIRNLPEQGAEITFTFPFF